MPFPVTLRTVGQLRIKQEANRSFVNPNLRDTLTGPGGTLTSRDVRLDRTTFLPDGTITSQTARPARPRSPSAPTRCSSNTVKSHTRVLYRKLDATPRKEAVAQAQRHGLI